jgi:hypothetical protein
MAFSKFYDVQFVPFFNIPFFFLRP